MSEKRYLFSAITEDLNKKMVFIGGPRQVGKTTLSLSFLSGTKAESHPGYLSWDDVNDRQAILNQELPAEQKIIILDEVHKYKNWRALVKGLYDKNKSSVRFIVTGSAKLDYFLKGGETLMGRYHYYMLHPFSLNEISKKPSKADLEQLINFGGFPEPFLSGDTKTLRRWQLERNRRVVYDDLRDLESVKDISILENLLTVLPERVGSPLSIEKLRILLNTSHQTMERYIQILERLYVVYRIPPYGSAKVKAVKKEQKLYFYDWAQIADPGIRFENMIAGHLLKYCHYIEDTEGFEMELRFIRNVEGKEIDFIVLKNKKPHFAVECKSGERQLSSTISYYKDRLKIPKVYQVHLGSKDFGHAETTGRVLPFLKFCSEEELI